MKAHMWANTAAASGDPDSVELRDQLEERMSASDVAEAQRLTRTCIASDYRDCD